MIDDLSRGFLQNGEIDRDLFESDSRIKCFGGGIRNALMNEFCVIRREMQKLERMNGSLIYEKGIVFPDFLFFFAKMPIT